MKWTEAKKSGDNMNGQDMRDRVGPMVLPACFFCTAVLWVACSSSSPVVLDMSADKKSGEVGVQDRVAAGDMKLDVRMQDIREAEVVVDTFAQELDVAAMLDADADIPTTTDVDIIELADQVDSHDGAEVADVEIIDICVLDCTDAICGDDDGCDGLCQGLCLGEQEVCEAGVCFCQPDCEGKQCGEDGCGGNCGECQGPQDACVDGGCVCQPLCEGKDCGEDGCDGGCGDCEEYWECDSGLCLYVPWCGDNNCDADEACDACPIDCSCCAPPCDSELEECVQATTGEWVCAAKMVEIPAGNFWMGCNNCDGSTVNDTSCWSNEHPYHEVHLDEYEIDRTEVTAAQYLACKKAGWCSAVDSGIYDLANYEIPGKEDHPMNYVSRPKAEDYCLWVGKQLCTEAQWEKGARGGCEKNGGPSDCKAQSRKFPWGNETPTCVLVVKAFCEGQTQPVCSRSPAGDSPYGLCDMAGNAMEWVADWYFRDYYCAGEAASGKEDCVECSTWADYPQPWDNPGGPTIGSLGSLRGGGKWNDEQFLRVSNRYFAPPDAYDQDIGFRCCGTP
jgi:formylglycine-generating enzyme required for sulfatase activity